MQPALVARQPIYERDLQVAAYEMLFRSAADQAAAPTIHDPQLATLELIDNLINDIGMLEVSEGKPAFINISYDFIVNGHATTLPKEKVVLEVLEDTPPVPEVVNELSRLSDEGFTIALDDFIYAEHLRPLIDVASIIKFDLNEIPSDQNIGDQFSMLKDSGKTLLAEKVETHEQFETCLDLGFDLFQGYFFCRPKVIEGKKIPASKLAGLRLLAELENPNVEVDGLASILQTDPALCLKLLRFVNSSVNQLRQQIDTIKMAVSLVGLSKVKAFARLATLTGFGKDKPQHLIIEAMSRARMCENVATQLGRGADKYFTAGLFSLLDAFLDQPMEVVLTNLPLDVEISHALGKQEGDIYKVLQLVKDFHQGRTSKVFFDGLDATLLQEYYFEALGWAARSVCDE